MAQKNDKTIQIKSLIFFLYKMEALLSKSLVHAAEQIFSSARTLIKGYTLFLLFNQDVLMILSHANIRVSLDFCHKLFFLFFNL